MVSTDQISEFVTGIDGDSLSHMEGLVADLTRQLAVATAVRDALACMNGGAKSSQVGKVPTDTKTRAKKSGRSAIKVTDKTRSVAELILANGAMTKTQIAKDLGWAEHAVRMVLGRSKKHFIIRPDGKVLVAERLADMLEA